jgi:hypothetical protein
VLDIESLPAIGREASATRAVVIEPTKVTTHPKRFF